VTAGCDNPRRFARAAPACLTAYTVRDDEAALDIVQDAMIRLVERYADRPAAELGPLFQRILGNATMDWFRRQRVREGVVQNLSDLESGGDDGDFDLLERLEALHGGLGRRCTAASASKGQTLH